MFDYLISAVASPTMMTAAISRCTLNGSPVDCGSFGGVFLALFGGVWLLGLAVMILMVVSNWKVYSKAGKPGWTSIIPVYNIIILLEIVDRPVWWVILMFVPFVNVIISIILLHRLSLSFGKDVGFTIGLFFLPFIFLPILAFGQSQYQKFGAGI